MLTQNKCLAAVCCLVLFPGVAQAQLLVNEFSQGPTGSKEYLEFVVEGQRSCIDSCADIRRWLFDDNNGWYGTGASSQGFYRLKDHPNWACVPFGSIIVVYNHNDLNAALPLPDPTDANGDHVYVLPINSSLIEYNNSTVYTNTGFVPAVDWSGIVLNNVNDAVQTIDPANLTTAHHAVGYGSNFSAPVNLTSGGSQTVYYLSNDQYNLTAGWAKGNVSLYQTPGAANTPANANWLQGMNTLLGPVSQTVHQAETICAMQLPYQWHGWTLTAGGDSCAVYTTPSLITGCDSTVVLDLEVLPAAFSLEIDTAGCGPVFFEGTSYTYDRELSDTLYNRLGCDSVYRHIGITVHDHFPGLQRIDTSGCHQVLFEGILYVENTVLTQRWQSRYGCDSINRVVYITVDSFQLDLHLSPDTPYAGEAVVLQTSADKDYSVLRWKPETLFPKQQAAAQYHIATSPLTVTVYAESALGCSDSATVSFGVLPLDPGVFIPNAFSPNGDGLNDVFTPLFRMKRAYYISRLQVFDRWGKPVYHSTGASVSWNGNDVNGLPANDGTYHYRIRVTFIDGGKRDFKGEVVLLR